jgi:hypothetical protein
MRPPQCLLLTRVSFAAHICIATQPQDMPSQLLALSIAIEHPTFSADPQVLCAAAQACKTLQQAVRQRRTCNLAVVFGPTAPLHQLPSFANWMAGHSHLVSSITTNKEPTGDFNAERDFQYQTSVVKAQVVLERALQGAADAAAAAAAGEVHADDAGATPPQQQQQQLQLRLASFSTNYASLAMLISLPAHSLTHLRFDLVKNLLEQYAEVPAALARFSNLQRLQLGGEHERMPGSCLAGIAQLSKLTQLQIGAIGIGNIHDDVHEPLQQLLAQPLPLRLLQLNVQAMLPLDLTALTQLEELITDGAHQAKLPGHLRSVKMTGVHLVGSLQPLMGLQQLQHLDVCICLDVDATADVLTLTQRLPMLKHLALQYTFARDAALASRTWQKLPQLLKLSFDYEAGSEVHQSQIDDILAGVAAATSLTKLELEAFVADGEIEVGEDDDDDCEQCAPVAVCRQLSKLTGLRDLSFTDYTYLKPGDAQWLTALTNLTRLVLCNMRDGFGDAAAAAIASSLTQLRQLNLGWCELGKDGGELAEAAQLVHLTELRLEGNSQMSRDALIRVMELPTDSLVRVGLDKQQSDLVEAEGYSVDDESDV